MNPGLTEEAAAQLQEGINLVLFRWAALRMAVDNQWGGRDSLQKSHQLSHSLFHCLTQSKEEVYIEDMEDMLDEFMLSLNTEIDDGSVEEVSSISLKVKYEELKSIAREKIAEKLMVMREECLEGKFDSIKMLKETNVPSVSYNRQRGNNDEDDSDDGGDDDEEDHMDGDKSTEMEVDAPQSESNHNQKGTMTEAPEVADGWTVVASRRSKGKRN